MCSDRRRVEQILLNLLNNAIIHNGRLDKGVQLISKPYHREQLALKLREILDPS